MNAQEIFDFCVRHLKKQGRPAIKGNTCVYRDAGGGSCAVGCLIPDNLYHPDIELCSVASAFQSSFPYPAGTSAANKASKLKEILVSLDLERHSQLLVALQAVHDKWFSRSFWGDGEVWEFEDIKKDLHNVAALNFLNTQALDES